MKTTVESKTMNVKTLVDRFLSWPLPSDFNPDGGITFNAHPAMHRPVGTNLLSAAQAESMIRHMLDLKLENMMAGTDRAADEPVSDAPIFHAYRVFSEEEKADMMKVKDAGLAMLEVIEGLSHRSRESSIAKTKVEEAVMWAVKHITAG